MYTALWLMFLTLNIGPGKALKVEVTEVTTSSVRIHWSGISNSVEFSCFPQSFTSSKENYSMTTTKEAEINISNLRNGGDYQLIVKDNSTEWSTTITLASCPFGWTGHSDLCYRVYDDAVNWTEASAKCDAMATTAYMVQPRSANEIDAIGKVMTDNVSGPADSMFHWVGVKYNDKQRALLYGDLLPLHSDVLQYWEKCNFDGSSNKNCFAWWPQLTPPYTPTCGAYLCQSPTFGYVCQYSVSDSPKTLSVTVDSNQATVTWRKPPSSLGSTFSFYDLKFFSGSKEWIASETLPSNESSWHVNDLYAGHLYYIQMTAVHELNDGQQVRGATYSPTHILTRPLPPQSLKVHDVTPTRALIEWTLPREEHNNRYTFFSVHYNRISQNGLTSSNLPNTSQIIVPNSTTFVTLEGLEPFVSYDVIVVAISNFSTSTGEVKFLSNERKVEFKTPVSPPRSLNVINLSSSEITVTWEAAIGSVDQYSVAITSVDPVDASIFQIEIFNNSTRTTSFDNLLPGAEYELTFKSLLQNNASEPVILYQRTRPLPVAPQQVSIHYPISTNFAITINAHSSEECIFDGYNVTLQSTVPRERIDWRIVKKGNFFGDVIPGLTPGRTYSTTIWTTSGDVKSLPGHITPFTTEPGPPTNLRLKSRDERNLWLEWDPAPGDFDSYLVSCYGINCSSQFEEVKKHSGNKIMFHSLVPGELYDFSVVAQQGRKLSKKSFLSIRTLPIAPRDLTVQSRNDTYILLTWLPAKYSFDGYSITYIPTTDEDYTGYSLSKDAISVPVDKTASSSRIHHQVSHLIPGVKYNFTVVTTSGNTTSKPAYILSTTVPQPVNTIQVLKRSEYWMLIGWKPGEGFSMEYQVTVLDAFKQEHSLSMLPSSGNSSINLTSLLPSSKYFVEVVTISYDDVTPPVEKVVLTRPLPPSDAQVMDVSETKFILTWKKPWSNIDNYIVQLYVNKSTSLQKFIPSGNQQTTKDSSITFSRLIPGKEYKVAIVTNFSEVHSYSVERHAILYPNAPENLTTGTVSSSEIFLTWQPGSGTNGGFDVDWKPRQGNLHIINHTASLTELTPGVKYEISVFSLSETRSLRSKSSAATAVTTVETSPGPIETVTLISFSNTSISAKWRPPSHPNGRILYYVIKYRQLFPHPSSTPEIMRIPGDEDEVEIEDLEPGAGYFVQVAAENAAGVGSFTKRRLVKPLEATPGPVQNLTATALSSSSVHVAWQPPEFPNGVISLYLLTVEDENLVLVDEFEFYGKSIPNPFSCLFDNLPGDVISSFMLSQVAESDVIKSMSSTKLSDHHSSSSSVHSSSEVNTGSKSNMESGVFLTAFSNQKSGHSRRKRDSHSGTDLSEHDFEPFCPVKFTVVHLEPYSFYYINVSVWTSAGEGEMASTVVRTLQEPPGGPPMHLRQSGYDARSIALSWYPPLLPNGIPLYTVVMLAKDKTQNRVSTTNETYIQLTDLSPYTAYAVAVRASTDAGPGPWSSFIVVKTNQDVPDQVQNLSAMAQSPHKVVITWFPPINPHGVIKSFFMQFYAITRDIPVLNITVMENLTMSSLANLSIHFLMSSLSSSKIFLPPQENTSFSDALPTLSQSTRDSMLGSLLNNYTRSMVTRFQDGLVPDTDYFITVAATTSAGKGIASGITVRTHESIPGSPPINLKYHNLSSTSIHVSWDPPLNPNGIITGYTVGISSRDGMIKQDTDENHITVTNLLEYHPYEVYVWPWTLIGEGPSSVKLHVHTAQSTPGSPPLNVTYKNITSSVIKVQWHPPLTPNGIITQYTVYYENSTGTFSQKSNEPSTVIERLKPYGLYLLRVTSSTKVGEGPKSAVVTVRTMEGQPTTPPFGLSYVNITSTSVNMAWLKPITPNGIIQFYDVILTEENNLNKSRLLHTPGKNPSLLISGLKPHSFYTAVVRTNTKYGDGDQESKPLNIWTLEDVPGSSPRLVSYINESSTSIKLSWQPPLERNGLITLYTIKYSIKSEPDKNEVIINVPGQDNQVTIIGLKEYTFYDFSISASTRVGEGPVKNIEVLTDEGEPTSPPYNVIYNQLSSTAIVLSWQPPLHPNGIIINYTVAYSNGSRVLRVTSVQPEVTLTNLRKFGEYSAYVTARTRVGDGLQRSRTISFKTLEDAPSDPPSNLVVIPISSTSLKASWLPPKSPNGLIQFYTLYYQTDDSAANTLRVTNNTESLIPDLQKYTWYDVWVTASTALGDGGHKSRIVRIRTQEDVPSAPLLYNCTTLSNSVVDVRWRSPLQQNGVLQKYKITVYKENTKDTVEQKIIPATERNELKLDETIRNNIYTYRADNLRPYTAYVIDLQASTKVGFGEKVSCKQTTDESVPSSPVNLTASYIASNYVFLKWKIPINPNGIILGYKITYEMNITKKKSMVEMHVNSSVSTSMIEYALSGLKPHSNYTVKVFAFTSKGTGSGSESVILMTLPGVPDSAVENLFGEADSSTSISVNWNVATPITGPTYFLVTVQPITAQSLFDDNVFEANVTKENLTVTDLVPFTSYLVTVISKVYGVPGNGPKAEVVVTTDEDRPMSSVVDFKISRLTSTSANLTWKPPVQANGVITFYNVYISPGQLNKSTPGNQTFGLMRNLEKFSTYKAVISSSTIVGSGPQATLNFTTLQDVPSDSPQNLEVSKITNTSALLSWDSPLHPNGILTYFTLRYRSASLPSDVITALYPAKSVVLDNLLPHSNYFVSASASTKIGMGPYTKSPLEFTTEEGIPGAPRKLNCISLDNHTILISWMDPEHSNGVLKKFDVTYKNAKNGNKGYTSASHTVSSFNISGLVPHSLYQVDVRASTRVGSGPAAQCNVTTEEGLPSPPVKIKAMEVTATSITVNWEPPISPHGIIRGYDVIYVPPDACKDNNGVTKHLDHNQRCVIKVGVTQSKHLFHLNKYTDYRISIRAYSGKGVGLLASPGIEQRTSTGVPDFPVRNVQVSALSSTSINVSWQEPLEFAGVTSYLIKAINTKTKKVMQSNELNQLVKSQVLTELQPYSTYEVSVTVITSAGSLTSSSRSIATKQDVPYDPPSNISTEAIPKNSSAVIIFFRAPKHRNGPIMSYSVEYKTKQNQDVISVNVSTSHLHDFPVNFNQFYSWNLTGLLGGRTYVFRMRASTEVGSGPWSPWGNTLTTPVTAPPVPQSIPSISKTGTTSSSITVGNPCVFSNANGALSSISVVVAEDGADLTKSPTTWHEAYFIDPSPPYMVLYSNNPEKDCLMTSSTNGRRRKRSAKNIKNDFVIGNDNSCKEKKNQFCNGPLKSNSFYRFKYRAETVQGQVTYTMFSQPVQTAPSFLEANSSLIIGVAVAAVVFIALLTAAVIIIRRRKNASQNTLESDYYSRTRSKSPMKNDEEEETIKGPFVESGHQDNSAFVLDSDSDKVTEVAVSRPVSKLDFGGHISRLCMNKNKGFSSEFDDIRGLPTAGTTSSSDKPFNRTKNRHAKLVPFDQFRVKLETISGIEGSDYINASFIPGQLSVNQFIATQYPLEHTKKDFWKMMWETKASTIALLGNQEEEKKRPDTFWPRKQSETYGPFAVQLKQEDIHPEWTIRHFILSSRDQSREITQFHLTKWPISDGSGGSQIILRFVQTVRASRSIVGLPLVVMCSSGSGKSGVFICLDRLLENLQLKSHVDVFGTVAAVRRYRPYMVQSMGEYILVYQCMQEAINEKVGLRRPPTGDGLEETVF